MKKTLANGKYKRSDSYIGTIDPTNASDMAHLAIVKNNIKTVNKSIKYSNELIKKYRPHEKTQTYWRVILRGRLGKNNPHAWKYVDSWTCSPEALERKIKYREETGEICTRSCIQLKHAQRIDVYVCQRRSRWE